MASNRLSLDELVHPNEVPLFSIMIVVSVLIYGALIRSVLSGSTAGLPIAFYGILFAIGGFVAHALAVGRMRGNGVLVSERQFPDLHDMVVAHGSRLGVAPLPAVYVMESGGILNAFATKLLGRKFVIVNSEVLALAVRQSPAAVSFIVGHELGHHWRNHLKWRWLTAPARLVPFLGAAYSRACEYTCDRVGAFCEPEGALDGLTVLAAGGWLRGQVDVRQFADQAETDQSLSIDLAELLASHPRLPKRVASLMAIGVTIPAAESSEAVEAAPPSGPPIARVASVGP